MPLLPFTPFNDIGQLRAGELARLANATERQARTSGAGGIGVSEDAAGFRIRDSRPGEIWIKITAGPVAAGSATLYSYSQIAWINTYVYAILTAPDGLVGTSTSIPAVEVNGQLVPVGTIVRATIDVARECLRFNWEWDCCDGAAGGTNCCAGMAGGGGCDCGCCGTGGGGGGGSGGGGGGGINTCYTWEGACNAPTEIINGVVWHVGGPTGLGLSSNPQMYYRCGVVGGQNVILMGGPPEPTGWVAVGQYMGGYQNTQNCYYVRIRPGDGGGGVIGGGGGGGGDSAACQAQGEAFGLSGQALHDYILACMGGGVGTGGIGRTGETTPAGGWGAGGATPEDYSLYQAFAGGGVTTGANTFTDTQTIQQGTLGNNVAVLSSTATNDDPTVKIQQNRVTTTDATTTTLHTITLANDTAYTFFFTVLGRRTGGTLGTANDSAVVVGNDAWKCAGGTAARFGGGTDFNNVTTRYDNAAVGFGVTVDSSGADVRIRVTGALLNNYTWHLVELRLSPLST